MGIYICSVKPVSNYLRRHCDSGDNVGIFWVPLMRSGGAEKRILCRRRLINQFGAKPFQMFFASLIFFWPHWGVQMQCGTNGTFIQCCNSIGATKVPHLIKDAGSDMHSSRNKEKKRCFFRRHVCTRDARLPPDVRD